MGERPTLGFIGLGNMGRPMVLRLLEAGYRVLVSDRRWEVAQALELHGAEAVPTPLLVADQVDVFLTCLPGDEELFEVYIGPEGALEHLRAGALVIDLSTASPMMVQRIADEARARQIDVIDAPVGGGPAEARNGNLTIIVGADAAVFERALPILQTLGRDVFLVGDPGMGKVVKLVGNLIAGVSLILIGEALALAANAGADLTRVYEVIRSSSGGWKLWTEVVPELLGESRGAGFRLELMKRDMELAMRLGNDVGSPVPLAALAHQFYVAAMARGWGGLAAHEVARLVGRLANVQFTAGRAVSGDLLVAE
ncbi:NAD(P)-dependent oxidoreductase [Thermomicrobium sp. 4228-Ro]|uniref:NAD(P)-dependent oxidoreductase n=1 Tax=Thermomicrobium sp. 4228-Ro TaxID=2993937 RepID=UPI00224979B1|nr:NAD(P)-dependent oxidoreductase [Thermomicrobium sp. 4228-Ro]MCX2727795.1 NAD(P)-dependent oxidoreductase [Thermomicrobium sp. 4228-Ro]